jgi:hypothetical protein
MKYRVLELSHEQNIVDNSEERGSRCWGMRAGRRIFRDLWLDHRSAGLGGGVGCIKDCFPHIWKCGGKRGGPNRRKAAWGVHEPQILELAKWFNL